MYCIINICHFAKFMCIHLLKKETVSERQTLTSGIKSSLQCSWKFSRAAMTVKKRWLSVWWHSVSSDRAQTNTLYVFSTEWTKQVLRYMVEVKVWTHSPSSPRQGTQSASRHRSTLKTSSHFYSVLLHEEALCSLHHPARGVSQLSVCFMRWRWDDVRATCSCAG